MKKIIIFTILVAMFFLASTPALFAQSPMTGLGGNHWRMRQSESPTRKMQSIDRFSINETVVGEVVAIDAITSMHRMSTGVHLQLKTDIGVREVRLAPTWYLDNQGLQIKVGDRIEVKGFKLTTGSESVLIVAEVSKGDRVLVLRNEDGIPVWSGQRHTPNL
ncbi:hypothetical protein VB774_09730 [Pseudanabaena galeata UHCC 0370]|uniref:Magnetosome protein MamS/MamX domain-containing protein n=1 Tax=Pseudanabaena galeata UHCC 0370 TaxID=3110310 RepID=A0ABU5TJT3_9CYAN|nr:MULTISPECIES: hypothetical protein [Pseudanabaena]MEA5477898.1 hypothetical protein [Pseudanabaena galeata UHCC 0370]MEA5487150.1 hypothetical protein [Pseudanabaena sp. CCNP1317]WGS75195.1 hypothetical protein OA858_24870 [Pseudanabaena galeata CCNP1313]